MKHVNTGVRGFWNVKFFAFLLSFLTFTWSFASEHGSSLSEKDTLHAQDMHGNHEANHGDEGHGSEPFTAETMTSTILHHISDAHEWHFFTVGGTHVTLPLPVILYSSKHGLDIFMSGNFYHNGGQYKDYKLEHEHVSLLNDEEGASVLDFSITKNVASMILALLIMAAIFISMAKAYKRRPGQAPKGLQSFMEPLVLFVRDEIARPNLGHSYMRFMPYLLTLFFFIWINNLLGLLPGAANVTGNIAVTMVLALIALIVTNINGNKTYWGHIFWPPGIPLPVKIILIPVEIISIFTKPFALMIRLFANITAGHIIIMSIICLIFLFGESGTNASAGFGVSFASVPFAIFLYTLELLVAAIQAFIFTMLTALFIGQAMPSDHH